MSLTLEKNGMLYLGGISVKAENVLSALSLPVHFIADYRIRDLIKLFQNYPVLSKIIIDEDESVKKIFSEVPQIGSIRQKIDKFVLVKDIWIIQSKPQNIEEQIDRENPSKNIARINPRILPIKKDGEIAPLINTGIKDWADTPLVREPGTAYHGGDLRESLDASISLFELVKAFGVLVRMEMD